MKKNNVFALNPVIGIQNMKNGIMPIRDGGKKLLVMLLVFAALQGSLLLQSAIGW